MGENEVGNLQDHTTIATERVKLQKINIFLQLTNSYVTLVVNFYRLPRVRI